KEFKNEEEVLKFYNIYAYKAGFSIRKKTHYKARKKDNMITSLHYVCSKEGHSKPRGQGQDNKGTPKKQMQYSRTGCKAHLRVKLIEDGKWVVTAFVRDHNHDLVVNPSKARFLRSHRSITKDQKDMIHMLSEQNISTTQIMSFMAAKEGGSHNIHFTRKDLNNEVSERNRRLKGEFETGWNLMLEKYELYENNHLQIMWNSRRQWVPAYFRDSFFAQMSTSQRSESMNAFIKMFMDCHTSIYKFVIQFEKIVSSRYDKEDEEDFRSKDSEPSLWSFSPIEKQARDICTRKVFTEFKNQLRASTRYEITELEVNSLYNISSIESSTSSRRVNSYTVRVDRLKENVSCSCKFFEFSGLLCSHVLKVMLHIQMHHIPDQYIMKRWTKNAKRGFSSTNLGCMIVGELSHSKDARFNALLLKMQKISYIASQNFEAFEMACEDIDKLVDKIIAHNEALKEKEGDNIGYRHATIFTQSSEVEPIMKDPPQSQCKGKRKPQRFKPPIEKGIKKS
ncbi:Protein FAR1-RELATED SEQUENCE 5, partial [Ananas comosus]